MKSKPTVFEFALLRCFDSGHYVQAKFLLLTLSRVASGQDADDLIFVREFVNNRLFMPNADLSDLDRLWVSRIKKVSKNEPTLCNFESSKNLPANSTSVKKEKINGCDGCFWKNDINSSVCDRCNAFDQFNYVFISEHEKEQGREAQSLQRTNQTSQTLVGHSGSLSHPFYSVYYVEFI